MDSRQFQRIRWYVRLVNLLLIVGLVFLIVYNCHPAPGAIRLTLFGKTLPDSEIVVNLTE